MSSKPQCGSDKTGGETEYNLPLHVAGLFIILLASCLGAGFPVVAKKVKWLKVPPKVFFACKHFGTGVLIATAFVHLLPTAFGNLLNPCLPDLFTKNYPPMPGVIMMGSMFILFIIEMYLNAKTGGHSHGGPMGFDVVDDHQHDLEHQRPTQVLERCETSGSDTDSTAYDSSEENNTTMTVGKKEEGETTTTAAKKKDGTTTTVTPLYVDEQGNAVEPEVYKKMSANITLLEGGILFHSVFVGMTISITIDGFIILLIALVFHQAFEGLGLGSRIAAVPYPKKSIRPWILVFAFGTTAPLGQAIGLITRNTYDPNSAFGLIIVGVFNAISSGLLIYAALVDLLAEDFLSEEAQRVMKKKDRIAAFCWVLAGAAGMSIVGAFA